MKHLSEKLFTKVLSELIRTPQRYQGVCYRVVSARYGNQKDAFSGGGSYKASGRFHCQGQMRIVYTSCSLTGALWEYGHTARHSGLRVDALLPFTVLGVRLDLQRVLDLTSLAIRSKLSITQQTLCSASWSSTQVLGRLAYQVGFEALKTPSTGGHDNLNLFPDNFLPNSRLQIINEQDLPPSKNG